MSAAGRRDLDPPRAGIRIDTGITAEPLDVGAAHERVSDPSCGGVAIFVGVVRDHHEGEAVTGLTYESWEDEAPAALRRVAREVAEAHAGVRAVYAWHRTGPLTVGEPSVIVATSAPHRGEALEACREVIDRLKAEVPIWKQEHLVSGNSRWPGIDTDT